MKYSTLFIVQVYTYKSRMSYICKLKMCKYVILFVVYMHTVQYQLVSIVSVSSSATAGMSSSVAVTSVAATDCVERSTSDDVERSTSVVIICSV